MPSKIITFGTGDSLFFTGRQWLEPQEALVGGDDLITYTVDSIGEMGVYTDYLWLSVPSANLDDIPDTAVINGIKMIWSASYYGSLFDYPPMVNGVMLVTGDGDTWGTEKFWGPETGTYIETLYPTWADIEFGSSTDLWGLGVIHGDDLKILFNGIAMRVAFGLNIIDTDLYALIDLGTAEIFYTEAPVGGSPTGGVAYSGGGGFIF
jgi:hypothetical protein